MRYRSLVLTSILLASTAYAKELKAYQDAKLLQMDSVQCGTDENAKKGKTHELLCQNIWCKPTRCSIGFAPKTTGIPYCCRLGQNAQFRLDKNKMLLRVEGFDNKEREYVIMSIKPRGIVRRPTRVRLI